MLYSGGEDGLLEGPTCKAHKQPAAGATFASVSRGLSDRVLIGCRGGVLDPELLWHFHVHRTLPRGRGPGAAVIIFDALFFPLGVSFS